MKTVWAIIAEARDEYAVHKCSECTHRKSCDLNEYGFDSPECKGMRESIALALGVNDGYFTQLLDRLEAAAKREVDDAERRGHHAATKAICDTLEKVGPLYDADSIGNAAKLREALVLALSLLDLKEGVPYKTVSQKDIDFMKAALAAPARNCDMGTPEEQNLRMHEFCKSQFDMSIPEKHMCHKCILRPKPYNCTIAWAQMPYEESEAAK